MSNIKSGKIRGNMLPDLIAGKGVLVSHTFELPPFLKEFRERRKNVDIQYELKSMNHENSNLNLLL
jgi:hypothetical protein